MVKSIFLDLDDTILDFQKAEKRAISETLRSFGIEPTAAVVERYHQLNRQQWELLEEGKLTRPQVLTRRFDLLFGELGVDRSSHEAQAVYEVQLSQGHFFMPGAWELLETLAPRYDLYLEIFVSEQMGANKPSPAFFQACFAAIPDFDPAAALVVGDSLTSDIRGARNVGLRSCWYNPEDLPPRPDIVPDYTIRTLEELPPLLERL